jgi:hypothetical protein
MGENTLRQIAFDDVSNTKVVLRRDYDEIWLYTIDGSEIHWYLWASEIRRSNGIASISWPRPDGIKSLDEILSLPPRRSASPTDSIYPPRL